MTIFMWAWINWIGYMLWQNSFASVILRYFYSNSKRKKEELCCQANAYTCVDRVCSVHEKWQLGIVFFIYSFAIKLDPYNCFGECNMMNNANSLNLSRTTPFSAFEDESVSKDRLTDFAISEIDFISLNGVSKVILASMCTISTIAYRMRLCKQYWHLNYMVSMYQNHHQRYIRSI